MEPRAKPTHAAQRENDEIQRIRRRMNATGIGYAGLEGAWWLIAAQPFRLPAAARIELANIGRAIFALFDAVADAYAADDDARSLLNAKIPADIPRAISAQRVRSVRPDFQLRFDPAGAPYFIATELEICPSAHGAAHAMQVGYGLHTDLADAFARFLGRRELWIAFASAWSEFLFDQLTFCRALAERGIRARLLLDTPFATLAERIARHELWRPPMFGVPVLPPDWRTDVAARIEQHGFDAFIPNGEANWPDAAEAAVAFRFGYLDCFAADRRACMQRWEACDAAFLNPTSFIFDSKVVMAALGLLPVRQRIAAHHLAVLDRCIPETRLLTPDAIPQLQRERHAWVLKFAGYDGGQRAWGGRSLQVGALHTTESWQGVLRCYLDLPFPVVAQRAVPSARVDLDYADANGERRRMHGGNTRLRCFMLREGDDAVVCGAHLTASDHQAQVSEGIGAIQAPVTFDG